MKKILILAIWWVTMIQSTIASGIGKSLSKTDEAQWLRHLLPLPHEIAIIGKQIIPPDQIGITLRPGAGDVEQQAFTDIIALFTNTTGCVPNGQSYEIWIGVVDAKRTAMVPATDLERLRTAPHSQQAYTIQNAGDHRLVVAALNERGVYHGVCTLRQLLEPFISSNQVAWPTVRVLDWPDLDERGLWNHPVAAWLPWMSLIKLNYGKLEVTLAPLTNGVNHATANQKTMELCRRHAVNGLATIFHYNFLDFKPYPELAGIGESSLAGRYFAHKEGDQHRAPCMSRPEWIKILAEWMTDVAEQGAPEVSCWLTERPAQCGCKQCRLVGQFVLESRATVKAWQQVRQKHPDFGLRIFISTTTSEGYFKVLAELPAGVKVERACATALERVPCQPRDLLANPLLDYYAGRGVWMASYDVPIAANSCVDTPEFQVPESSPHRVRHTLRQLYDRKFQGAYGMNPFDKTDQISSMNIHALAEWGWNMNGRTEKEFAIAWATRQGFSRPELVGDWVEIMGPIEFDVYDSDFPVCYSWKQAVALVRDRKPPVLGEGMFRYYASAEAFDRKIADCDKALKLVERLEPPDLANETRVVRSYVKLAHAVYQVAYDRFDADAARPGTRAMLKRDAEALADAGRENVAAIRAWRLAIGPEPWHHRVHDAMKATEATVGEIAAIVAGEK